MVHCRGPAQTDVQSVKSFFSKTCAADDNPKTSLCSACNVTRGCTKSDLYGTEAGAFRGLVEGSCDVAFTKHTIPALYAAGGANADRSWKGLGNLANYQILCPTQLSGRGLCTNARNFRTCNWGSAPGRTVMTPAKWPVTKVREFQKVLELANNSSEFQDLVYSGKNRAGMLFSADTVRLDAFTKSTATRLGPLYNDIQSLERMNDARSPSKAISPVPGGEAPSFDPVPSSGDDESISPLLIGGIIAGGILVLLVTGGVLICLCRKRPAAVIKPPTPSARSYTEASSSPGLQSESTWDTHWTPPVATSEELVTSPGLELPV